jgi:hypothetical protein
VCITVEWGLKGIGAGRRCERTFDGADTSIVCAGFSVCAESVGSSAFCLLSPDRFHATAIDLFIF